MFNFINFGDVEFISRFHYFILYFYFMQIARNILKDNCTGFAMAIFKAFL